MPLQETSGNVTTDAYGGGAAAVPNYIEDVFSTYLYTGNGSTQTITNGIDLAGKGGLVWVKNRNQAAAHVWVDTARGASNWMNSASATGQNNNVNTISSLNSNGFSVGNTLVVNNSGDNIASWTFRKQPKFFDVVTWTGNGVNGRLIPTNVKFGNGGIGAIFVKRLDASADWKVFHRSITPSSGYNMILNSTAANVSTNNDTGWCYWETDGIWLYDGSVSNAAVNANGGTYVAYVFAHDAGGFGLTGTDNVISCGSFTTTGSNQSINLGYEPQWVLLKQANSTGGDWYLIDTMRGWTASYTDQDLFANLSNAEGAGSGWSKPTATGFDFSFGVSGRQWIYIAIRRGPMKVPTSGTSVYQADTQDSVAPAFDSGLVTDLGIRFTRLGGNVQWADRLRGNRRVYSNLTDAEGNYSTAYFDYNTGWSTETGVDTNIMSWMFSRAPSFFDEVCYTGTGSATTVTHNLGVAPQLIIAKSRSGAFNWTVYSSTLGNSYPLFLNGNSDGTTNYGALMWGSTAPTSTQFPVGTYTGTNSNGQTYVAYLFATCAGVSKVGSYTGNGSTQTINCGFTGGARFVLIKRTDAAGDWYVYDTARGMTTLTDPYLLMNSTAAESATLGSVTTVTTGFAVNASILAAINTNAASYIFFAVA